jgi:hypothetical protein
MGIGKGLGITECIKQQTPTCYDLNAIGIVCYNDLVTQAGTKRILTSESDICIHQLVTDEAIRLNVVVPCDTLTDLLNNMTSRNSDSLLEPQHFTQSDEEWCCYDSIPFSDDVINCPTDDMHTIRTIRPLKSYCSVTGRYSDLDAITPVSCTEISYPMPGVGTKIARNTMDEGYYPSLCLNWNTVQGKIGVYRLTISEDNVIPSKIREMDGKLVAFSMTSTYVIDESSQLYGEGNSGHDCISYGMDKKLHDPDNCLPISFVRYNQVDYFSGVVRSSGLSHYFDYFDLIPTNMSETELAFDVRLRQDIDYDLTITVDRSNCPVINYTIDSNECHITWSQQQSELTYKLGDTVLKSSNYEINSVKMEAGQTESLSIVGGIQCASLTCLPHVNQLITYPVGNEVAVKRPNGPEQQLIDTIKSEIMKQESVTSWQIALIIIVAVVVAILVVSVIFLGLTRVEYTN